MRVIKFRGLRVDGKGFVYGCYGVDSESNHVIVYNENISTEPDIGLTKVISVGHFINPESVGQFTGLQDKNGVDIYEGDIVNLPIDGEFFKTEISFTVGRCFNGWEITPQHIEDGAQIIGNIHKH